MFITDSNECIIEMEVTDKGVVDSGIENFLFLIDGEKDMRMKMVISSLI